MLEERRVVGAGAQVADRDTFVSGLQACRSRVAAVLLLSLAHCSRTVPPAATALIGDLAQKLAQRRHRAGVEFGPATASSHVEVGYGVFQLGRVLLHPFVDPMRPSSSPSQLATTMVRRGFHPCWSRTPSPCTAFEHGRGAGPGSAAPRPGVAVVAAITH